MNKSFIKKEILSNNLFNIQKKFLNKTFKPTKYNLRLQYSNLNRNHHSYGRWDTVYGPDGYEKTTTDRNPDNFKYKTNLFNHTIHEMKHIFGDVLYQMVLRRRRLGDPFMKYVMPTIVASSYLLLGNHLFFLNSFIFSFFAGFSRMMSKTEEPKLDEVWLYDFLLNHEEIKKYMHKGSFHVIDFNMEYDEGFNSELFPNYDSSIARFFNTDTNTTKGFMKIGDLETGALITINFKTMPYSANQFMYSDPFLVYDMIVDINHKGDVKTIHAIKAEDVLQSKKVFVPLF